MRTSAGIFMSKTDSRKPYNKPALDEMEQLNLLLSRNLLIPDHQRALHYLRFIGYYRLSGYALFFQDQNSRKFKNNTSFDNVLDLYIFDRELRLLVMDAIERIEVAVRTCISNYLSLQYGSHWFLDKELFISSYKHEYLVKKVELETGHNRDHKNREMFIDHYFNNYNDPKLPPSWMVAEVMPLGTWSKIYKNLRNRDDQKKIAQVFSLHYSVMASWLHSLTYLRNLCAHHSRLWNRRFSIKPKIMKKYHDLLLPNNTFYAQSVMLYIFMHIIADGSKWQHRLANLLTKHNQIQTQAMGFPKKWDENSFWRMPK